jgi:signal transduction histidine kinase
VARQIRLAAAIESKLGEFQARTGIRVEAGPLDRTALSPEGSTAVFRIVQEALSNVEHSGATCVTVSLERGLAGLVLQIRDNGRGNPTAAMGLLGMRKGHVPQAGKSPPASSWKGTTLWIEIPIPAVGLEAPGMNAAAAGSGQSINRARRFAYLPAPLDLARSGGPLSQAATSSGRALRSRVFRRYPSAPI